jgi:Family of unknown function (DUF6976)
MATSAILNNDNTFSTGMSTSKLATVEEVSLAIVSGSVLWLSGDVNLLKTLPTGKWIGGSIPYFMSQHGGKISKDHIFMTEFPANFGKKIQVKAYNLNTISNLAKDGPDNGFTMIMIPGLTDIHLSYAQNAPDYEDMFIKPVVGWITGVHLDDLGTISPVVVNGVTGEVSDDKALAMHVTLNDDKVANIGIVNCFTQGGGPTFEFPSTGFSARNCLIDGVQQNLADYMLTNDVDTQLPFVADYSGAMINVSFQNIDEQSKTVNFYAPVFEHVQYKQAKAIPDYVTAFSSQVPNIETAFSCNCILNFLYSELEGKKTGQITGPITFGEVAYQLLNQTMVYMTLDEA